MANSRRYKNQYNFVDDPTDELSYSEELAALKSEKEPEEPNTDNPEPTVDPNEDETWKDRYGNLRRHNQNLVNKIKELENEVKKAGKKEIKYPKSEDEFNQWLKDYPDASAFIETLVLKRLSEYGQPEVDNTARLEELETKLATERAYNELVRRHPDFPKIQKDKKFHEWIEKRFEKNPNDWVYRALFQSIDVDGADEAVTYYKQQNNIKASTPKDEEKEAASAVRTSSNEPEPQVNQRKFKFKESEIAKMSDRDFEKNEEAIMEAWANGEVEMDLKKRK